jgi:hypothetical protein
VFQNPEIQSLPEILKKAADYAVDRFFSDIKVLISEGASEDIRRKRGSAALFILVHETYVTYTGLYNPQHVKLHKTVKLLQLISPLTSSQ